jgi:N-acetyl sugar amidotransferase
MEDYKRCAKGLWDTTIPSITFDNEGVSDYARMFERLVEAYPRGEKGATEWNKIVENIKQKGKGKRYDCIIGVSGGTDSSYLLHLSREYGLRPLAVNLDNGWNSDISVKNIKKVTAKLNIDLETYVIDYEEIKDLLRAYMRATLPWVDIPTDIAIKAVLYKIAAREGIRYILRGNDFRSEGSQPREWTYGDGKQLLHVHKKFGSVKLKTFPNYSLFQLIFNGYIKGIKSIYPFYFLEYKKNEAQKFLQQEYQWEYYGGHHHENIFTKFAISYWLPVKFGIDKRIITLSAQVMSGEISREQALETISKPSYDPLTIERDIDYVIKKLDLSREEFEGMMKAPKKYYTDYPSYYPFIQRFSKIAGWAIGKVLPYKPMALFQMEMRDKNKQDKTG